MNLYKRIFLYCYFIHIFVLFPSINQSIYITSSSNLILKLDNTDSVKEKEYLKYYYDFKKQDNEGFAEGTVIQTTSGFKPIEDLNVNDSIYSFSAENKSQFIKYFLPKVIANYIKIKIKDNIIKASPNQLFYDINKNYWIQACDLKKGDFLLKANDDVDSIEIIDCEHVNEPANVYALTTSSGTYHVTDNNIYVHNADVLRVIAINPILALLGAPVAYMPIEEVIRDINEKKAGVNSDNEKQFYKDINKKETECYLKIRNELLDLREHSLSVKNALVRITTSNMKTERSFTLSYLSGVKLPYDILNFRPLYPYLFSTSETEEETRKKRKKELEDFEDTIIEIQTHIVSHFNGLMDRIENGFKKISEQVFFSNKKSADWNKNIKNITINIAIESYKATLEGLMLVDYLENCIGELGIIIQYYKNYTNLPLIGKTTNILDLLQTTEQDLLQRDTFLNMQKYTLSMSKQNEEAFLKSKGIVFSTLQKKVEEKVKKDLRAYEAEALLCAKNNRSNLIQVRKDDKKDDDKKSCPCKKGEQLCLLGECECTIKNGCIKTCSCNCNIKCKCKCPAKKPEFFDRPEIKPNYEHDRDGVYKLMERGIEVAENAHFLKWDYTHSDVEVGIKSKNI